MRTQLVPVRLTAAQRRQLEEIVSSKKSKPRHAIYARVLLKSADGMTDLAISQAFDLSVPTISSLRKKLAEGGVDACFARKEQENRARKVAGREEAAIAQIACSAPPDGLARWSLRLIAERVVELEILPSISHETIGQVLKKTKSNRGARSVSASRQRKMPAS